MGFSVRTFLFLYLVQVYYPKAIHKVTLIAAYIEVFPFNLVETGNN